jgi:hypothetical protein
MWMWCGATAACRLEDAKTHFATKKAVPTHEMLSEPSSAVPITGDAVDTDV